MGVIESGSVSIKDVVKIRRTDGTVYETVIGGIELFKKITDKASKGDNAGLLLNDMKMKDIRPGDVILK